MTYLEIADMCHYMISCDEIVDGNFWRENEPDHPFDQRRWWDFVNRKGVADRYGLTIVDTHTGGPHFFICKKD